MKQLTLLLLSVLIAGCTHTAPQSEPPQTSLADTIIKLNEVSQLQKQAAEEAAKEQKGDVVKVKIETTLGVIEADLFHKEVPTTVDNFVELTKKGFYDGIIFHRVIPNFMVQTGDPTGTGRGGPGYQFEDEFSKKLRHDKPGVLSMANSGPDTNGSQFFITVVPTPWLDDHHSVFGQVTNGMDVVNQIVNAKRDAQDKPLTKIAMTKVTVAEE